MPRPRPRPRPRPHLSSQSHDPHCPGRARPSPPRPGLLSRPRGSPPRSHAQVREEVEGFPPPSCPLRPTTQVARAPPGPVRFEATRAPRGHLPGRLSLLWGGSQRPGRKGAGWGGAAAEDREGRMAGAPRDASRSLATPPRHYWAIRAGAARRRSSRESRVCPGRMNVYFSSAVLFLGLTVYLGFDRTGPFFGFSLFPACLITTSHRVKKCVCDNLSQKLLGLSQPEFSLHLKACFKSRAPGLEGSNYKDLTGRG